MKHKKITVAGNVQGVFFRQTALQKAKDLNVNGWIQNDPSGTVTVSVEGPEEAVNLFEEWCKQGPPLAKVAEVLSQELPLENFSTFEIRRI